MQSSKKYVLCLKPCNRFWLHYGHLCEVSGNTYLLTPWSRVLLEKLSGFQQVKKFPTF